MPFEIFYRELNRARNWWLCVGAALALIFGYPVYTLLSFPDPLPESLSEARRFERVGELCNDLSLPERFELVSAEPPRFNSSSTRIIYNYRSERSFEEIIPTFLIWFEARRWDLAEENDYLASIETRQPRRQLIFRKNLSTVEIIYYSPNPTGDGAPANYQIICSQEEITFNH